MARRERTMVCDQRWSWVVIIFATQTQPGMCDVLSTPTFGDASYEMALVFKPPSPGSTQSTGAFLLF